MRRNPAALFALLLSMGTFSMADTPPVAPSTQPASALDFIVKDIHDKDADLAQYKGKAVLIVNVASKCGYTPQYKGLEALYAKYKDQGLVVIGFPANNFKSQEPGTNKEILEFCTATFQVDFPMMSKVSVKGDDIVPLYKYLTSKETAGEHSGDIAWNFTKFLIGRDGKIAARFPSKVKPEDPQFVEAVEKALKG